MFTGIVEGIGTLSEVKGTGGGFRVRIQTPLSGALKVGDSLAVNGVCLTVILLEGEHVLADVGPETSRITTLGSLQRGQEVNLERPLRIDARFDGHFVTGHVDGISLTVAGLGERQFDVMVIPFTWGATTLKGLRKGDKVNLECDMIGKYVA